MPRFDAQPSARQAYATGLLLCAALGSVYAAAIGAVIAVNGAAARPILVAAGALGLIGGVLGGRYRSLTGLTIRMRFGSLFMGFFAALGSAMIGAFLALVAFALTGAIPGALGGWLAARYSVPPKQGPIAKLLGVVVGACLGAIIACVQREQATAIRGMLGGLAIGAVAGPAVFFAFLKVLIALLPRRPDRTQT